MRPRRREAWTPGRARVPHARDHRPLPAHRIPSPSLPLYRAARLVGTRGNLSSGELIDRQFLTR